MKSSWRATRKCITSSGRLTRFSVAMRCPCQRDRTVRPSDDRSVTDRSATVLPASAGQQSKGGPHARRCHNLGWRPRHPVRRDLIPATRRGKQSIRPAMRIDGRPRGTAASQVGAVGGGVLASRCHHEAYGTGDAIPAGTASPRLLRAPMATNRSQASLSPTHSTAGPIPRSANRRGRATGADPGRHRRHPAGHLEDSTMGAGTSRSWRWSRPPRFR